MYNYLSSDGMDCIFAALNVPKYNYYYYKREESVTILHVLLLAQNASDETRIHQFLWDLRNVIDMRLPKVNIFQQLGPANCGKNFFMDSVVHYFLNWGQIRNITKFTSFPLQECINKGCFNGTNHSSNPHKRRL